MYFRRLWFEAWLSFWRSRKVDLVEVQVYNGYWITTKLRRSRFFSRQYYISGWNSPKLIIFQQFRFFILLELLGEHQGHNFSFSISFEMFDRLIERCRPGSTRLKFFVKSWKELHNWMTLCSSNETYKSPFAPN